MSDVHHNSKFSRCILNLLAIRSIRQMNTVKNWLTSTLQLQIHRNALGTVSVSSKIAMHNMWPQYPARLRRPLAKDSLSMFSTAQCMPTAAGDLSPELSTSQTPSDIVLSSGGDSTGAAQARHAECIDSPAPSTPFNAPGTPGNQCSAAAPEANDRSSPSKSSNEGLGPDQSTSLPEVGRCA